MFDARYTTSDHERREDDAYANAKYDLTMRWLGAPRTPGARLLNIGCGGGHFNTIAAAAGYTVEACEPDPVAYALATARAPTGVVIHLGGIFDAPLTPGADVIVMHDVLEHIDDDAKAVQALHALVAASGRVILSVPAMQSLFGLHDELLGHYRRYGRKSLRVVVESAFEINKIRSFGFTLIPVTLLLSRVLRQPYPADAASGKTLLGRGFDVVCRIESRVASPVGTSLICAMTPR